MSSIGVLASLSTTLVQRKTNPNSNTSSEFQTAQHLLPLFHLTLPGIDVNDPVKGDPLIFLLSFLKIFLKHIFFFLNS